MGVLIAAAVAYVILRGAPMAPAVMPEPTLDSRQGPFVTPLPLAEPPLDLLDQPLPEISAPELAPAGAFNFLDFGRPLRVIGQVLGFAGQFVPLAAPIGQVVFRIGGAIQARAAAQAPSAEIAPSEPAAAPPLAAPEADGIRTELGLTRTVEGVEQTIGTVEIRDGLGVGVVQTVRGLERFEFEVPFPEVGF